MKTRLILRAMTLLMTALALAAGLWGVMPVPVARAAVTYYSQGSLAPNLTSSWNTNRIGGGIAPTNFTGGDIFVIQNGHTMTTSATWSISGTGSRLWIENGGTLRADHAVTLATATTFQIDNGGTYIHNNEIAYGSSIFQGTENFAADSTVILNASNNTGPSSVAFGNLIINFTTDPGGAVQCSSGITTINGNFSIQNTQGREFRLSANTGLTLNIAGDLTISGGFLNLTFGSASPTINLGGNFNQTGGTFTSSGSVSTIIFTSGSSNVTFATSGGTFTNNNINWQIAAGKTVGLNTNFGGGSWVNASRTMTVNGAFQINQGAWPGNGGAWSYGPAGTLIYNNSSGSYGVGNDNYWPTSNGPVNVNVLGSGGITMNVARTINGTFQTAAGVINGTNLTLNGTAQINTGGYFDTSPTYGAGSTLVYNPGGSYTIGNEWVGGSAVGSGVPQNVTIQNDTNVSIWNGAGTRTVPGNLTISSGSLTLGSTYGDDLAVGGNWINNGVFNANNRAVIFNGTGVRTIGGSSATAFDYLTVNSGVTVIIPTSNTPIVNNTLTNNGTLSQTRDIGTDNTVFLNIGTAYYGVEIDPDSTAMGQTTVTISGNQFCPNASAGVRRCFDIAPASPQSATVRFYFTEGERNNQALINLKVWHRSGSAWVQEPGTLTSGGGGNAQYVEVAGVDEYSPFSLSENTPTMVDLARFEATPQENAILVTWETASELDNVGFNLYRSTVAAGPYTQLNNTLIPPQFPGEIMGGNYEWLDTDAQPGVTYFYKLEDIDVKGVSTFHGPVSTVVVAAPMAVVLQRVFGHGTLPALMVGLMAVPALVLARHRSRRCVSR